MTAGQGQTGRVLILGGGAAGLLCAREAGRRGRRVTVVDKAPRLGAKIRIAGGGKANFTNRQVSAGHYLGHNPHFVRSCLARFGTAEAIGLVEGYGLGWEERDHGRLFLTVAADRLVAALEAECRGLGVEFRQGCEVFGVRQESHPSGGWTVDTSQGPLAGASLVLALGGPAWPACGATDTGLRLARSLGLAITEIRPGLAPLRLPAGWPYAALTGIAVAVGLGCGPVRFHDQLLFTHTGLSGPAALQISSHWRPGQELTIDLLPGEDVATWLEAPRGGQKVRNLLSGRLPARLVDLRLEDLADRPVAELSRQARREVVARLQDWRLTPAATGGLERAEVTVGGVDTRRVSSQTFAVEGLPRLHAVGEVLDVAGQLGGYNLHFAFASGLATGRVL